MAHATVWGMLPRRLSLGVVFVAASFGVAAGARGSSARRALCSLVPLEMRYRMPGRAAFLGTILADTVLAGAGSTRYATEAGHYGRGTSRTIYGQMASVDRLEQAAATHLRESVADDRTVVLVPWDYSASCEPVPWTASARWLTPGARGVFVGALRERAHWVGSRPTIDVTPEVAVYPSPQPSRRRSRVMDGPMMSAAEFLALYEVLPDGQRLRVAPDSAVAPLLRWAQAFPELATKQPAAYFLRLVAARSP